MKNKIITAVVLSLCLTGAGAALTACNTKPATSDKDPDIYAVYQTYAAYAEANSQTPLSYEEWLNSIKGASGKDGTNGKDGADGKDGKSAYEIWKEAGNEGTVEDFLNSLKGAAGEPGAPGTPGSDGAAGRGIEKVEYSTDGLSLLITYTDGQTATVPIPDKHEHTYSGYTTILNPTCEGEGLEIAHCTVCNEAVVRPLAALGHNYGEWELTQAPAPNEEGEAVSTCLRDDTHKKTVTLPTLNTEGAYQEQVQAPTKEAAGNVVFTYAPEGQTIVSFEAELPALNGEDYYLSPDTATCEEGGKITYTFKQMTSFTFDVATPALGHQIEVFGTPVEGGGEVIKACALCGQGSAYAYGKGLSITSNAKQTLNDGMVHYISATVTTAVPFRFTVPASGAYTLSLENLNATTLRFSSLKCITVGEDGSETAVNWAISRGYAANSEYAQYFTITTTAGAYVPGDTTGALQKNDLVSVSFNFAEEQVGKIIEINISANGGTAASAQYLLATGSAQITPAAIVPKLSLGGVNFVIPEGTYLLLDATQNRYNFTAPKAGWYKLTISTNALDCVLVRIDGDNETEVLDTVDNREYIFEATEGQQVTFAFVNFSATRPFTVALEETEEPVAGNALKVGVPLEISSAGGNPRTGTTEEIVVDSSVAQGTYILKVTPNPVYGRTNFYASTNNSGFRGTALTASNGFTAQLELKGGDTLYITHDSTTSGYFSVTITAVTE